MVGQFVPRQIILRTFFSFDWSGWLAWVVRAFFLQTQGPKNFLGQKNPQQNAINPAHVEGTCNPRFSQRSAAILFGARPEPL
jgi:hypothetical protein